EILDLDLASTLAAVDEPDSGAQCALKPLLDGADFRPAPALLLAWRHRLARLQPPDQALRLPNREAAGDHLGGCPLDRFILTQAEQSACMAHVEGAVDQPLLDLLREAEETQGVGDGGALLPHPFRASFLRQAEFLDQATIGLGLLDRVEVGALDV